MDNSKKGIIDISIAYLDQTIGCCCVVRVVTTGSANKLGQSPRLGEKSQISLSVIILRQGNWCQL